MNDAHYEGPWGAPQVGMSYRDEEGRPFLLFSLTTDYIYIEYGGGEIQTLCRAEWSRMEPRPVTTPRVDHGAPAWAAA